MGGLGLPNSIEAGSLVKSGLTLPCLKARGFTEANLKRSDAEWERLRPEKSKQVAGEEHGSTGAQEYGSRGAIQNLKSKILESID